MKFLRGPLLLRGITRGSAGTGRPVPGAPVGPGRLRQCDPRAWTVSPRGAVGVKSVFRPDNARREDYLPTGCQRARRCRKTRQRAFYAVGFPGRGTDPVLRPRGYRRPPDRAGSSGPDPGGGTGAGRGNGPASRRRGPFLFSLPARVPRATRGEYRNPLGTAHPALG